MSVWVEIFHIIAIYFNSVYRVEILTRVENLHIISPLKTLKFIYLSSLLTHNLSSNGNLEITVRYQK